MRWPYVNQVRWDPAVESTEVTAQVFPRPRTSGDGAAGLRRVLKLARTHLGMEIAWISEFHSDEYVIRSLSGDGATMNLAVDQSLPLIGSFCVRVLAGTLPPVVAEARRNPVTRELAVTQEYGIGSYAGVPLLGAAGKPVGMLCCISRKANPGLDAQALRFLELIGELISEHLTSSDGFARTVVLAEADRIRTVLERGLIRMEFQPVKRLEDGALVAYEALARFDDPDFPTPAHGFAAAARAGIGVELELLAVKRALDRLPDIPPQLWLGVNLSAEALIDPAVQEVLLGAAAGGHRLGIEITEHTEVHDYVELTAVTQRLRAAGIQIGVDDAGAGYASFRHILKLRPTVIKLDLEIVRDVDVDLVRQALTRSLVSFAVEAEAVLVAEGIETEAELKTLRFLGVGYGQGFLLARPGPLPPL
jgi:EAL domain-containing protein (putative c-di-GMP-specific phosphodiesterase class I)